jgi:mannose-6-phosphate isomerase-like protein (cupin superfamily)
MLMSIRFETKRLPVEVDRPAPDRSLIRFLPTIDRSEGDLRKGGGMIHCTLRVGMTSKAKVHRTVDEIWYVLCGMGQVYRKQGDQIEITDVYADVSLTIPVGTHFQFRNVGEVSLEILIITMPPWPGDDEAVDVDDYWQVD